MAKQEYIMTPEFRVSFPAVFKPEQYRGKGDFKYSLTMLFPPETNITELKDACKRVAKAKWGDELQGIKWPFKDGTRKAEAKDTYKMYKGCIFIKASSKSKPQVIQPNKDYIYDDTQAFYAGCWARAIINPFTYESDGRGVSFGLGNIQKVRDDEPFSGRPKAEDQFDPIEAGADDPSNYEPNDMMDSAPAETVEL